MLPRQINQLMVKKRCSLSGVFDPQKIAIPVYKSVLSSLTNPIGLPGDNRRDVKWACNDLLNRKLLDGVCILDGALMRANPSFTDDLCRKMGSMWSDKISNLIRDGDKYGIVIEDFDKCMKKDGNFEEFVVSLAEESVGWKKFSVLLTMRDHGLAMDVSRWNSGEKIYKSLLL